MKRRDRNALRKARAGKPARVVNVEPLAEEAAVRQYHEAYVEVEPGRYRRRDMRAKE